MGIFSKNWEEKRVLITASFTRTTTEFNHVNGGSTTLVYDCEFSRDHVDTMSVMDTEPSETTRGGVNVEKFRKVTGAHPNYLDENYMDPTVKMVLDSEPIGEIVTRNLTSRTVQEQKRMKISLPVVYEDSGARVKNVEQDGKVKIEELT